jgi:hypothetical protein
MSIDNQQKKAKVFSAIQLFLSSFFFATPHLGPVNQPYLAAVCRSMPSALATA